jgi:capsid protein
MTLRRASIEGDRLPPADLKAFNFFDAAYPSPSNLENWGHLYPEKVEDITDPQTLMQLRLESLCEVLNDDALNGMVSVAAESIIGRGAMTRVEIDRETDTDLAQYIEELWQDWVDDVQYAKKLRVAEKDLQQYGTYYRRIVSNPHKKWQMDVVLVSPMRIANPDDINNGDYADLFGDGEVFRIYNGIAFDYYGNERYYCVLKKTPLSQFYLADEYSWVAADVMCHIFDPQFSEQIDGHPMTTPSLEKGVMRRTYEKEELKAARLGATLSGAFQTSADFKAMFERLSVAQQNDIITNMLDSYSRGGEAVAFPIANFLNLPPLTEVQAFDTKHPHAGFAQHRLESIKGQGRSLRMPEFVATGSAANYNYASVQKDSQWWSEHREAFRQDIELSDLTKTFQVWLRRAMLFDPKLQPILSGEIRRVKPKFYWKQEEHADPVKQAEALKMLQRMGIYSVSDIQMLYGFDPEKQKKKVKKDIDEMKGYIAYDNGVPMPLPDPLKLAAAQAKAKAANSPSAGNKPKPKPKKTNAGTKSRA